MGRRSMKPRTQSIYWDAKGTRSSVEAKVVKLKERARWKAPQRLWGPRETKPPFAVTEVDFIDSKVCQNKQATGRD